MRNFYHWLRQWRGSALFWWLCSRFCESNHHCASGRWWRSVVGLQALMRQIELYAILMPDAMSKQRQNRVLICIY